VAGAEGDEGAEVAAAAGLGVGVAEGASMTMVSRVGTVSAAEATRDPTT